MATRIFAVNPGAQNPDVKEAIGPTATSAIVAVVIDLASNITDGATGARGPKLLEVLEALDNIKEAMMRKSGWPPA